MTETLPTYDQLPVRDDAPPKSSWGVWGDHDMFGKIGQVMTVELAEGRKPFEECRDPSGCRSIP